MISNICWSKTDKNVDLINQSNDIILDNNDEKLIEDSSLSSSESLSMDDSQQLKLIGKYSFGKVILVKYINNNKIYAIKLLKKEKEIK